jgi:hypothetical protein
VHRSAVGAAHVEKLERWMLRHEVPSLVERAAPTPCVSTPPPF